MSYPVSPTRTLEELLAEQRALNDHFPEQASHDALRDAFLAEVGEVVNALKFGVAGERPGWCWWKRSGASASSREVVLDELVDVLHFILTGLLRSDPNHWAEWFPYERFWHEPPLYSRTEACFRMVAAFDKGDYHLALLQLVNVARHLGFHRHEFEDAYFAKAKVNRERWAS